MNAANEVVNLAFREAKIGFMNIPRIIAQAMEEVPFIATPSLEDYFTTDSETRRYTQQLIQG